MTNLFVVHRCKHCGDYIESFEEELWAHIQMEHEEIFEELQDLATPDMISEAYELDEL